MRRKYPAVAITAAVIAGVALAATSAFAAKAVVKRGYIPGGVPDLPCTIQVDFTSLASTGVASVSESGPDYDAFGQYQRYVIDTRDVDDAEAWGWGKQGEFSLCLKVHDPKEAVKILDDLTKLIPAKPSGKAGPVMVKRGASWK